MADHSIHIRNLLNTVFLVTGAVLIGGAIHASVVKGTISPTSPVVVLMIVLGGLLAALGYRFRVSPETARRHFTPEEPEGEDASYEPSLSPLEDSSDGSAESDENT